MFTKISAYANVGDPMNVAGFDIYKKNRYHKPDQAIEASCFEKPDSDGWLNTW